MAAMMSSLLPTSAIFVATDPVDLRKAFDGLATLVRQSLGQDPLSGSVYIFSNRQRNVSVTRGTTPHRCHSLPSMTFMQRL